MVHNRSSTSSYGAESTMTPYLQETDSRPTFFYPEEISFSYTQKPIDETLGHNLYVRFIPLQKRIDLLEPAWDVIQRTENEDVAREAKNLLSKIESKITSFLQKDYRDISYLPPLRAFNVDDGSVLLEWIFEDFRLGFSIEPNFQDSGWYLVAKRSLGEISASGYMSNDSFDKQIHWLLDFVFVYS